jgi:hypothetical protein
MKLILENWRKLINEEVVDLPNKATAEERYESYRKHMDAAIEQIEFLEEIFEKQGFVAVEGSTFLEKFKMDLKSLRDDKDLQLDIRSL